MLGRRNERGYTSPCKGEVDHRERSDRWSGGGLLPWDRSAVFDPHPARFARRPPPCRGRYRAFAWRGLAALLLSASGSIAFAQNEATPPPKDTIFARKILMATIDMNMDEVETMLAPGGKLNDTDAREHLDIISVLLMAFPHMFPASTNQWKPGADRDPALDT